MVLASWKKMVMYFGVGKSLDSVPEEFMARAMLYVTFFRDFQGLFPIWSGFASFAPTPLAFIIRSIRKIRYRECKRDQ